MRIPRQQLSRLLLIFIMVAAASWLVSPWHPTWQIGSWQRDFSTRLGLDLQGGTQLIYRADTSGISEADLEESLAGVRDVIERRVNLFGVSEPVVQTNRTGEAERIIVEMAGVHDPTEAIRLIGETPQLDFRREIPPDEAQQQFNIDDPSAISGPIFERTDLTGKHLRRSTVQFDPVSGTPQVNLEFDTEGTELFAKLTKENLGRRIAIYLDGFPISAPIVQAEITNGQAVISGGFTLPEAKELTQRLNAGALPVSISLEGQQTIGPTLGERSIEQSITAGLLGLLAVSVWMIVFYRLLGVVASLALVVYALLFIVLVKLIPVTLTLAGIAGVILSIGMAVDANVLIFERFRENVRQKKSLSYAMEEGFREAWGSIKASNVSSLITALILYIFGSSIIRGFALTYAIGIVLSMFTAISVTRTFLWFALRPRFATRPFWLSVPDKEAKL